MDSSAIPSLAEEVVAGLRFAYTINDPAYRNALLAVVREANQRVNAALAARLCRSPPPRRLDTLASEEEDPCPLSPEEEDPCNCDTQ